MTDVLVCDSEYDLSTQRRHVDGLARKSIDGLVLSGLRRDEPYPALLEADFPLVQVYDRIEAYHTDFVGIDAEAEARRITGQLAARKVHAYSSGRAMSRVNSYMSSGEYRPGRTVRP